MTPVTEPVEALLNSNFTLRIAGVILGIILIFLLFQSCSTFNRIYSENDIVYSAYDVLYLTGSSFKLDEKAVLIIDNETYPMVIDKIEFENVNSISENTTDVPTSDSTSVSVITGYSENNIKCLN